MNHEGLGQNLRLMFSQVHILSCATYYLSSVAFQQLIPPFAVWEEISLCFLKANVKAGKILASIVQNAYFQEVV